MKIDGSTQLSDLKQFAANLTGNEKLHAKYDSKTKSYTLYEAKGGGTGLKNFLFGTNAKREANVAFALRTVIFNHGGAGNMPCNPQYYGAFDHVMNHLKTGPEIKKADIEHAVATTLNVTTEPVKKTDDQNVLRVARSGAKISSTPIEEKDQDTTVSTPNKNLTAKFLSIVKEVEDFNAQTEGKKSEKEKSPSTEKPTQRFSTKHSDLLKEIESLGSTSKGGKTGGATLSNKRMTSEVTKLLAEMDASEDEKLDATVASKPTQTPTPTDSERSSRRLTALLNDLLDEMEAEDLKNKA